jgi:peptide/nickel transport system substrate-binding protein
MSQQNAAGPHLRPRPLARRLLIAVVLLALVLTPWQAATPTKAASIPRNQTLVLGFESAPLLSPHVANPFTPAGQNELQAGLHQAVFESLFYLNYETGQLEPWLAKSYQYSPNFTSVTINLRKGVLWSDGVPFTAADVVFTINMLKAHASALTYGPAMQQWVKDIKALNDYAVQITLTGPNPRFIVQNFGVSILSALIIVPQHIWQGQNPTTFAFYDPAKGWPVGTGPYRLVSAGAYQTVYDRRDDWWAAKTGFHALPAPKRIIFVGQTSVDSSTAAIASNQVDALTNLDSGSASVAMARNPKVIGWTAAAPYAWTDPCPHYFVFNVTSKPWNNAQLRAALAYSVDKVQFASLETQNAGRPAQFLFPDYPPMVKILAQNADLLKKYPGNTFDVSKARAIIQSQGYKKGSDGYFIGPDGKHLSIDLLMLNTNDGGVAWGIGSSLLTQDFNDVGVEVNQHMVSVSAYINDLDRGQFQGSVNWSCGSTTDPVATMDNFSQSSYVPIGQLASADFGRWNSAQYNAIVHQMDITAPGDPKLSQLFRQSLTIFLQQVPAIGLAEQGRNVPYNTTYWTNWPTAQNDYIQPANWWMTFHQILLKIKPTAS